MLDLTQLTLFTIPHPPHLKELRTSQNTHAHGGLLEQSFYQIDRDITVPQGELGELGR